MNLFRPIGFHADRVKSLIAVTAAVIGIVVLTWLIQRPSSTLLDRATLIISREDGPVLERLYSGYYRAKYHYSGSYSWINGSDVLLIREKTTGEWEAVRFSPNTRQPVVLSGLTKSLNGASNSLRPFYWSASSDGNWIFMARANESKLIYEVATLDGQEVRQWSGIYRNQIPIWTSDSKALVEWNSRGGKWTARVYRLDTSMVMDQPLDSVQAEPPNHEAYSSDGIVSQVDTGFETRAELLRIWMSPTNLAAATISAPPPAAGKIEFFSFTPAPDGRRIAWLLYVRTLIPFVSLQRQFPFFQTFPRHALSLWVSRSDGTAAKPLGHFRAGDTVHQLRWTPDNARISFVHDNQLWAIKAE